MASKRAPLRFTDFCQLMNVPPVAAEHSLGKTLSETMIGLENQGNKENQLPITSTNSCRALADEFSPALWTKTTESTWDSPSILTRPLILILPLTHQRLPFKTTRSKCQQRMRSLSHTFVATEFTELKSDRMQPNALGSTRTVSSSSVSTFAVKGQKIKITKIPTLNERYAFFPQT